MAVTAATIIDVASTGSDGNTPADDLNSGAFDPTTNTANFFTDLTTDANTANTTAPVVSSASYNFAAGDVGHWVFVSSGTNWTPGWYLISSVASNKATLDGTIGHASLYATGGPYSLNTAAGCATTGTPTAGTWTMCFSRTGTARQSFTDLASTGATGATPTVTSASYTFTKKDVGNYINISAGTNWTTGIFRVTNVSAGGAVLDRACGSVASVSSGTWRLGGSYLSPGGACLNHIAGNHIFVKGATYTVTSASTNISGGCVSLTATSAAANGTLLEGYTTYWCDRPRGSGRPTFQASGISTFSLVTFSQARVVGIIVDGASLTSSRGIRASNVGASARYCTTKNCTNGVHPGTTAGIQFIGCDATGCSAVTAFVTNAVSVLHFYCTAWSNTIGGFSGGCFHHCISINNSGASSDGWVASSTGILSVNCTAYGNGRDGFRITSASSIPVSLLNCISYGNTGTNFNCTAVADNLTLMSCAAGIGAANFSTNINSDCNIDSITLTADPFTNAAGSDFSINNTAGGGALLRAVAMPGAFPGITGTTGYNDVGAVEHQDAGGGGLAIPVSGKVVA